MLVMSVMRKGVSMNRAERRAMKSKKGGAYRGLTKANNSSNFMSKVIKGKRKRSGK